MKSKAFFYGTTPKGRKATVCGIKNENDNTVKVGIAICNPNDQFTKPRARTISEGRATCPRTSVQIGVVDSMNQFNTLCQELVSNVEEKYN